MEPECPQWVEGGHQGPGLPAFTHGPNENAPA